MTRAYVRILAATIVWSACVPDPLPTRQSGDVDLFSPIVDAEDARPSAGDMLTSLVEAAASEAPFYRRVAVRALGRLENPALSEVIAQHLTDEDAEVRATAAEALAQSVHGREGSPVLDVLLGRVESESDPVVRGALARSLGRLRVDGADRRRVAQALVSIADDVSEESEEILLGVALGFESLVRRSEGDGLSRPAAELLMELMSFRSGDPPPPEGDTAGRIRALAASALGPARRLSLDLLQRALDDPEPEVRRVVLGYLGAVPPARREGLLRRALADTSVRVRIAAVDYVAGVPRTAPRCELLLSALEPEAQSAVRVAALRALGSACPNFSAQRSALISAASALNDGGDVWQPAARALLSLASVDPAAAAGLLPRYAQHGSPFVRTWAARTAAAVRHHETLVTLATDGSPNVRTAAIEGLFEVEGHDVDGLLVEMLASDDPQLLITVAGLLAGAVDRVGAAEALVTTFERISEARRETWRDPRMALLERLAELGDRSLADRLSPFLRDYDPLVAERVATLLSAWTGQDQVAEPQPLPHAAVPSLEELRTLDGASLTLSLSGGGALVIELLAEQAPTNVARVVRLAEAGYYDGLTFHRWEPNFVIQGGSPGANEYQGDGPYTRDEVGGLPHWRGAVGLSTRGRDTGDGQLFINLVHNPRLDHEYTVLGMVVEGYDVLDDVLEGAVIERAVVERAATTGALDRGDP